jgi:hypothetical protein
MPVIAPASEAPKHHAARLMLMTQACRPGFRYQHRAQRPLPVQREADDRSCDHEHRERGRQGNDGHQQREQRDIHGQQGSPAVAVGQPRPEIEAGDADEERDLQTCPILRHGQREVLDDQRRHEREDDAVHAVEPPAEAVGGGDVPVRRRDAALVGDGTIVCVPHVLLFERTDACWTIRRRIRQPRPIGCCSAQLVVSSCAAGSVQPA